MVFPFNLKLHLPSRLLAHTNQLTATITRLLRRQVPAIPLHYVLCRVYARSTPEKTLVQLERAAAQSALVSVALSRSDAEYIEQHYLPACFPIPIGKPHVSIFLPW